jgi:hypothetical protein
LHNQIGYTYGDSNFNLVVVTSYDSPNDQRDCRNQLVVSTRGDANNIALANNIVLVPTTDPTNATNVIAGLASLQALFGGNFYKNRGNFNINFHYYN